MNLEKQVCSLELAKRLKELGVKQESYFQWYKYRDGDEIKHGIDERLRTPDEAAAFTVAELGEMLPPITGRGYISTTRFKENDWHCEFFVSSMNVLKLEVGDTEAAARAKMLIYLLENNLLTL